MAQKQGAPISMKNESLKTKHQCSVWKISIMIMASDKYASLNSAKEISALESKFVNVPSILASYVKSKYQAWYILSKTLKNTPFILREVQRSQIHMFARRPFSFCLRYSVPHSTCTVKWQ